MLMSRSLDELFTYLDGLCERAPLPQLVATVRRLDIDCAAVADFIRFSEKGYMRNLVRGGEWYHVLVLCWKNGQRSPIHDHAGSTCAVRVLRGTLTETVFEFTPHGYVKATLSRDLGPGSVTGTEDEGLHQISNLQAGDADLVTLHVYTPPLWVMGTYSLTDSKRGQELMFMDFSDAAGI